MSEQGHDQARVASRERRGWILRHPWWASTVWGVLVLVIVAVRWWISDPEPQWSLLVAPLVGAVGARLFMMVITRNVEK